MRARPEDAHKLGFEQGQLFYAEPDSPEALGGVYFLRHIDGGRELVASYVEGPYGDILERLVFRKFSVDVVVVHLRGEGFSRKVDIFRPIEPDTGGSIPLDNIHLCEELYICANLDPEAVASLRFQRGDLQKVTLLALQVYLPGDVILLNLPGGIDDHHAVITVYYDRVIVLHQTRQIAQADHRRYLQGPCDDR